VLLARKLIESVRLGQSLRPAGVRSMGRGGIWMPRKSELDGLMSENGRIGRVDGRETYPLLISIAIHGNRFICQLRLYSVVWEKRYEDSE
jgi:hypothetical protein